MNGQTFSQNPWKRGECYHHHMRYVCISSLCVYFACRRLLSSPSLLHSGIGWACFTCMLNSLHFYVHRLADYSAAALHGVLHKHTRGLWGGDGRGILWQADLSLHETEHWSKTYQLIFQYLGCTAIRIQWQQLKWHSTQPNFQRQNFPGWLLYR